MRQLWSVARLSWRGRVEIGRVDLEHRLDLDGEIIGQVGASDDEAGMSAAFAEDGDEKVRGAVHHQCLLIEFRRAIDEAAKPQAAADAGEIAMTGGAQLDQQVQHHQPGRILALLEGEVAAEATLKTQLVAPSGPCTLMKRLPERTWDR